MNPQLAAAREKRRYRLEWLLLAIVSLLVLGTAAYELLQDRREIEANESDRLRTQARVVSDNLLQQFAGVDKALTGVRDDFFGGQGVPGMEVMTMRRLQALTDALPGVRTMFVLDARGVVVASNRNDIVGRNLSEREYFATPRSRPDRGVLYISRPFKSIENRWVVNLTRVLTTPDGAFAGVVVAGLDPEHFNVVLGSVLYAPDMGTTLVHGDGIVFLNMPLRPAPLGVDVNKPGSFFTRHRESGSNETLFTGRVLATGENRMVATRTIERADLPIDRPMIVLVGRDVNALYAPWRHQAYVASAVLLMVLAGSATALFLLQRRRREYEALSRRARLEREDHARRLRHMTDSIPALIAYCDAQENAEFFNTPAIRVLGLDPARRYTLREALGDASYALHEPQIRQALQGKRTSFESEAVHGPPGVHILVNLVPDKRPDGSVQGFYIMSFDITPMKKAQFALADNERLLRAVTDNLPIMISYIDSQERLQFVNATMHDWLGVDTDEARGRPLREVMGETEYAMRREHLSRALKGERVEFELESHALGVQRNLRVIYVPDLRDDGSVAGIYGMSTDVTPLKRVERQLQALARMDALTGLPNRHQFNEKLNEALAHARASGDALALLFLDVDHFKSINDSLGHAAGDAVLREFGQRLQRAVRPTDCVARLAGDEFVIILEGLRGEAEPQFVARKILAQIGHVFDIDGRHIDVSTSVGIAFHRRGVVSASELLARADDALYEAKAAGRNTYRVNESNGA